MEEYTSFPCFIVIVRKRSLVPSDSLVWGLLMLAPIIVAVGVSETNLNFCLKFKKGQEFVKGVSALPP